MDAVNTIQANQPLFEARGIYKHFYIQHNLLARLLAGERDKIVRAVDGVDLSISPQETVGLVGESGCGKTTLGRLFTRLYDPTDGEILFEGQPVQGIWCEYQIMETQKM